MPLCSLEQRKWKLYSAMDYNDGLLRRRGF
ncbi:hypothetical protein ACJIZ3_015938 [Penstemon smallii]|uniref:Uncharacterized protein n=1 Tax=Penstemon smallii TaxID=265156 RepID=A0ABD3RNX4_9LAMI